MAELRLRISLESLLRKEPSHCELFIFEALPATLPLAHTKWGEMHRLKEWREVVSPQNKSEEERMRTL